MDIDVNRLNKEAWRVMRSASAHSAGIYVLSLCVTVGIPFLLLPLMTRYIDPHGYGVLSMLRVITVLSTAVTSVALRNPIFRRFSLYSSEKNASYLTSCLAIMLVVFIGWVACEYVFRDWLSSLTGVSFGWILFATAAGYALAMAQVQMTILQAQHRTLQYAVTQIFFSFLNVACSLVLVVGLELLWPGWGFAICATAIMWGAWGVWYCWRKRLLGRITKRSIYEAASFGAAAAPFSLSAISIAYVDRFFLKSLFSLGDLGVYAVGAQLAQGFAVLCGAFNNAVQPWIYRRLGHPRGGRPLLDLALHMVVIAGMMAAAAVVFYFSIRMVFVYLFPVNYLGALSYFPWLMGGALCNAIFPLANAPLFYYLQKKTLGVSGVLNLLSTIVLGPRLIKSTIR